MRRASRLHLHDLILLSADLAQISWHGAKMEKNSTRPELNPINHSIASRTDVFKASDLPHRTSRNRDGDGESNLFFAAEGRLRSLVACLHNGDAIHDI